jgi:hypothetical protein
MITHPEAMRLEADRWRAGIRAGEIRCRCSTIALPVDERTWHILPSSGFRCGHSYAVGRIYQLERQLEGN